MKEVSEPENNGQITMHSSSQITSTASESTDDLLQHQETVLYHESNLRALGERRRQILNQIDTVASRKQRHSNNYAAAQQRQSALQQAHTQQLSLQDEIQETLRKSQERLAKITGAPISDEQEVDKDEEELGEEPQSTVTTAAISAEVHHLDDDMSSSTAVQVSRNKTNNQHTIRYDVPVTKIFTNMNEFWNSPSKHGLVPFLRCVHSTMLIKDIMDTIAMEILALDAAQPDGDHRREAMQKTCLDISCVAREDPPERPRTNSNAPSTTSRSTLDPSIPLCPYELGGVCADMYCPYQHLEPRPQQASSILLRERLPLPALGLSPSPPQDASTENPAKKRKRSNKPVAAVSDSATFPAMDDDFVSLPATDEVGQADDASAVDSVETGMALPCWWMTNDEAVRMKEASAPRMFTESSVAAVLDFFFGIQIEHGRPTKRRTGTKVVCHISSKPSASSGLIRAVGRVLDGVRFTVHAGRFDIALSLPRVIKGLTGKKNDSLEDTASIVGVRSFLEKLHGHILYVVKDAFNYPTKTVNIFLSSFESALSLALMSLFLRLLDNHDSALSCVVHLEIMILHLSGRATSENLKALLAEAAENDNDSMNQSSAGEVKGVPDHRAAFINLSAFLAETRSMTKHRSAIGMKDFADKILQPAFDRLNKCSLIEKVDSIENHFEVLRCIIQCGYAVHAAIEVAYNEVAATGDVQPNRIALLQTLDSRVSQIASSLSSLVQLLPLMVLVLPPIEAMTVAIACALRRYEKAHRRLDVALQSGMHHSEFLWSQLLQLRASLPLPQNDSSLQDVPFSISSEHGQLAGAISDAGVYLNHFAFCGDFQLVQAHLKLASDRATKKQTKESRRSFASVVEMLNQGYPLESRPMLNEGEVEAAQLVFDELDLGKPRPTTLTIQRTPGLSFPWCLSLVGGHVKKLSLRSNQIMGLPLSLGKHFQRLEVLELDDNKLMELPESVGDMVFLDTLHVSRNRLTSLPESIGRLKKLREMHVSENRVATLPQSIVQCVTLESLHLQNNQLQTLPDEFVLRMPHLDDLRIEGNPVSQD